MYGILKVPLQLLSLVQFYLLIYSITAAATPLPSCTKSIHSASVPTLLLLLTTSLASIENAEAFSWWKHSRGKGNDLKRRNTAIDSNFSNRSRLAFAAPQVHRTRLSHRYADVDVKEVSITDAQNEERNSKNKISSKQKETRALNAFAPITSITTEAERIELESSAGDSSTPESSNPSKNSTSSEATLYTYHQPSSNLTLHGLGISVGQFKSFVLYRLQDQSEQSHFHEVEDFITSKRVKTSDAETRTDLRSMWFSRTLICDRTEVLAIYPSDSSKPKKAATVNSNSKGDRKEKKRGDFEDLLIVYCDRILGIMKDELNDDSEKASSKDSSSFHMKKWLEKNYGKRRVNKLLIHNFQKLSLDRQKNVFLHLLHWFKEKYPYYYDQCGACGASYREDSKKQEAIEQKSSSDEGKDEDDDIATNDSGSLAGSFLGYCYPNEKELEGRAGRTELYSCHKCGEYTRFPRYNNVKQIVNNGGRGRCGEYSIFLYRILRALGHEARWVVDWADHVWAEVHFDGRWVHMDPCEAALDNPFLYNDWGKTQTYIMAFWMPLNLQKIQSNKVSIGESEESVSEIKSLPFPFIQDVTNTYTPDSLEEILKRREVNANDVLIRARKKLIERFDEIKL